MIISIVGAYDREAVQTFVNAILSGGGITELRLLQMGPASYMLRLVAELKLLHDFEEVFPVDIRDLVFRDGVPAEVLVFMNSSFLPLNDFISTTSHLLMFIANEVLKAEVTGLKFLFGDNYRGLAQQEILSRHLIAASLDLQRFHFATISSQFEISRVLNSTEEDEKFRCYPKIDGTIYVYDPSCSMSEESCKSLSQELEAKIENLELLFTKKSSTDYPNIEASVLSRFLITYKQSKNWELAMRDSELCSRRPSKGEMEFYSLKSDVAIFLPAGGAEEDEIVETRLPELVIKHVQDASNFIEHNIGI